MKKILVVIVLGLMSLSVQGQWYTRSYGVEDINDLSKAQLNYALQRAQANVKAGKILTWSGVGAFSAGLVIVAISLDDFWEFWDDDNQNQFVFGSTLMLLGMASTAVGVPFWIAGASRKKQVEIALLRFNSSAYTGFKQPDQFGLSFTISF
ncbi:hypothetical protein [Draconibacterium mangrovi]|uniref:hypothetical protein n=1 Tax=Draconibacterium mangrovi TaxID=2697469 RepID=UPI0013D4C400|nr:hypothetical protein [Draconibacterium mangrovi]